MLQTLIVVLPLLTLITQQSQASSEMFVSYVIMLDIWYMVNSFFIFAALCELALALVYVHSVEERKAKAQQDMLRNDSSSTEICSVSSACSRRQKRASIANIFYRKHLSVPDLEQHEREQDHHYRTVSHMVKSILNRVYGEIDWKVSHVVAIDNLLAQWILCNLIPFGSVRFRSQAKPGDYNKIDYCARILFPVAYAVFVITYFCVVLR